MHAFAGLRVVLPLLLSWPVSDPAAVYAVLDEVVLSPDAETPTHIELRGAFALAEGTRGDYYRAPRIGVLRFTAGNDAAATKAMWLDLQRLAGTGQVVSFGSRYELLAPGAAPVRVVAAAEPAGAAPPFPGGWGVRALERVDYGPVRELRLLPRCLPVDLGTARTTSERPERQVVFTCTNCTAELDGLRYVFRCETSDGDCFASGPIAPGKGLTTWAPQLALQLGERVEWSVHVVGGDTERAPVARDHFVVPAAAVESTR